MARPVLERFEEKYRKADYCWPWQAAKHSSRGYGSFYFNSEIGHIKAHRASWILYKGAIPEDMHILHRCDNPNCVNPDHLFLGTHADNMNDMKLKGRAVGMKGDTHPGSKLTKEQVLEIRARASGIETQKELASIFGVSKSLISAIVRREAWS